jgi:hypothetical protein
MCFGYGLFYQIFIKGLITVAAAFPQLQCIDICFPQPVSAEGHDISTGPALHPAQYRVDSRAISFHLSFDIDVAGEAIGARARRVAMAAG